MIAPWKDRTEDLIIKTQARNFEDLEVTLVRSDDTGGYDQNGRYQDPGYTETVITANVQPANGIELQDLPEGRHGRDTIKIYTAVELKTVDDQSRTQPDQIKYDGKTYQIDRVWNRTSHFKALATKVER